jgi:hypothetical protein
MQYWQSKKDVGVVEVWERRGRPRKRLTLKVSGYNEVVVKRFRTPSLWLTRRGAKAFVADLIGADWRLISWSSTGVGD